MTGGYQYSVATWEKDHVPTVFLSLFGFGPHPDDADAQAAIERYFAATSQIRVLEQQPEPDSATIAVLETRRAKDAPTINRWLDRVVSEAYTEAGVTTPLPLFGDVRLVWPPIRVALTNPMQVLIRSRRDAIARLPDITLDPSVTTAQAEAIEAENDDAATVSLVVPIGGVATYPSMDRDNRSYQSVLFTAAHEWVHQYLAFYPLGFAWGTSEDAIVLNETAADMVAPYIAGIVNQEHPILAARRGRWEPPCLSAADD